MSGSIHVRIRELLAKGGMSPTRIARAVGCDTTVVYDEKERLAQGLPPGPPPPRKRLLPGSPWNAAREEILRKLWADGLTAAQIASRLGGPITRNAVISKKDRLDLPDRKTSIHQRRGGQKASRATKPKLLGPLRFGKKQPAVGGPEPLPPQRDEDIARVSFWGLDELRHCRWPVPDPRDVKLDEPFFCGDQRLPGHPYCAMHADRAANKTVVYRRPPRPKADRIASFADSENENA